MNEWGNGSGSSYLGTISGSIGDISAGSNVIFTPNYTWMYLEGGTPMAIFDEKKPFALYNVNSNSFAGHFAEARDAVSEAERLITADKSCRFVIFKALQIIEPEPVKTRVRELK